MKVPDGCIFASYKEVRFFMQGSAKSLYSTPLHRPTPKGILLLKLVSPPSLLYCPDYLANAGGIIDLHYQRSDWDRTAVEEHVGSLGETFREVIARAENSKHPTGHIAEERFA